MGRGQGKAEMHQGELKSACTLALSSTARPKTHYRDQPVQRPEPTVQEDTIRPHNRVMLQVQLLVYQLLHVSRDMLHEGFADTAEEEDLHADGDSTHKPDGTITAKEALDTDVCCTQESHAGTSDKENLHADSGSTQKPDGFTTDKEALSTDVCCAQEGHAGTLDEENRHADSGCVPKRPGTRMHLSTFQRNVLKVGARFARHARTIVTYIANSAIAAWERFWTVLSRLKWITIHLPS